MVTDTLKGYNTVSLLRGCAFLSAFLQAEGLVTQRWKLPGYLNFVTIDLFAKAVITSGPNWSDKLITIDELMGQLKTLFEAASPDRQLADLETEDTWVSLAGVSFETQIFYKYANKQFPLQMASHVDPILREALLYCVLPERYEDSFRQALGMSPSESARQMEELVGMPVPRLCAMAAMMHRLQLGQVEIEINRIAAGLGEDSSRNMVRLLSAIGQNPTAFDFATNTLDGRLEDDPARDRHFIYDPGQWELLLRTLALTLAEHASKMKEGPSYNMGDPQFRVSTLEEFPLVDCRHDEDGYAAYLLPNELCLSRAIAAFIYYKSFSGGREGGEGDLIRRVRAWACEK